MKKKLLLFFFIAFVSLAFFALKNRYAIKASNESQFIILNWRMTPSYIVDLNNPVTFTFHLKNRQNRPITDASLSLTASPDKSDSTSVSATPIHDQNGFYKTSFRLNQLGNWILFLTIKKSDGVIIEKELPFSTGPDK